MRADLYTQLIELIQSQRDQIHQLERLNNLLMELLAQYMTQEELETVEKSVTET